MVSDSHEFYSRPSSEQIAALTELARAALPAWGLTRDSSLELLAERENAVFVVTAGAGQRFVLRVHRAGYHSDAQIRSHVGWARSLQRDGVVHTADVVETTNGEPFARVSHPAVPEERQVSLLRWAEGTQLSELGGGAEQEFGMIGELMAKLHSHATAWEPPVGFDVLRWNADGLVGDDPEWGRFWEAEGLDADGTRCLRHFRGLGSRAVPGETRNGHLHAHVTVPLRHPVANRILQLGQFATSGVGIEGHCRTHSAAPELVQRHAGPLAEDVPEGSVDSRKGFVFAPTTPEVAL